MIIFYNNIRESRVGKSDRCRHFEDASKNYFFLSPLKHAITRGSTSPLYVHIYICIKIRNTARDRVSLFFNVLSFFERMRKFDLLWSRDLVTQDTQQPGH